MDTNFALDTSLETSQPVDVLSEHTLMTADELTEVLATTDGIESIPFDYGEGYGVELQYRPDVASEEKVVLKIDQLEYPLVGESGEQLFKKAGMTADLLNDYPPELTVPLLNWYLQNSAGSYKALVLNGKIVSFCKQATEVYSQVEILETILKTMGESYGVTPEEVRVHNVTHDLSLTQYSLLLPENAIQLDSGDVLISGLFVQNSTLGREALKISGMVARDYHHNAHISQTLVEQWDRRRSRPAAVNEDGVEEGYSDVYDWVAEAVVNIYKLSLEDMKTVKVLSNTSVGSHSGTFLNNLLDLHSVPSKMRGYIREAYADEDGQSFLHLWNAITSTANMSEVEERPKNVRKLMMVAGALAAHPAACGSCFRPTEGLDD